MGDLELHAMPLSPPSRAVHMTLDFLGFNYKYVDVDVLGGGTRTPEHLALNPQHTVPVLVDDCTVITESRAAITYLVQKHKHMDKNCKNMDHLNLYPTCPKKRSQVDQLLYFNMGTFYKRLGDCVYPVGFGKTSTIEEEKKDLLKEALLWVNQMTSCGFVLGGSMSIADIDMMSTMSTLEACDFMDLSPYKKLTAWSQKMKKTIPKYQENCQKGADQFGDWFKASYKPE